MIAVAGAAIVLSTLPASRCGLRRCLAFSEVTKMMRAGEQLALVGPILRRSASAISVASDTGLSCQRLKVRASRKIWSETVIVDGLGHGGLRTREEGWVKK